MKAVMLAMRYLTNAFGNIIDVVVIGASYEFLVQWNDEANVIEASSPQLITVSVCNVFKDCKKYMKILSIE